MSLRRLRSVLFCLATVATHLLCAWELPAPYKSMEYEHETERTLDYFVVDVNGDKRTVKNEEELKFVRGDSITVLSAVLRNGKDPVERVDVLGFRNGPKSTNEDDRNLSIDTATELTGKSWAVDPQGSIYGVVAIIKKKIAGQFFLSRIEPKLSYIDIVVNNKVRVMREGEPLKVKASDEFKVSKIITNLADDHEIKFQAVLEPTDKDEPEPKRFEIQVSNKNYVFAKIPLHVEGL